MSKDPAILFYTQDFLVGTMMMSDEQVGQYIRLLCLQHQKGGYLTEEVMNKICGGYDPDIFPKFKKNADGLFFNQRLIDEVERRKNYSESRRQNRLKKPDNISLSHDKDMETVTENETVTKDEKRKPKVKTDFIDQLLDVWKQQYMKSRGIEYVVTNKGKERAALGDILNEAKRRNPNQTTEETIQYFEGFFKACLSIQENWLFKKMSPSIILSQFNEINTILSNGKAQQFNTAQQFSDIDYTIFNKK